MIGEACCKPGTIGWRRAGAALLAGAALALGAGPSPAAPAAAQARFASPEAASQALADAWRSGRSAALLRLFGAAGQRLVLSGDVVAEHQARGKLAAAFDLQHHLERQGDDKAVLVLGDDQWPYPIPIVRQGSGWRFDVKAGAEQILDRRIGRNELNAIQTCRVYVEAQRDYAAQGRDGAAPGAYARKVTSAPGLHDGLYWPAAAAGEADSPLGPAVAAAEAQGYGPPDPRRHPPFHGYAFRILTRQGPHAPGGARSYVARGRMTGGFALVAYPVKYGDSGIMTFVVNQAGIVFQKNLGPQTAALARRMSAYDPDRSWKPVTP